MAIKPAKLAVEEVEIIFWHSEGFGEFFAEEYIFFVNSLFKEQLSVFVGDRVLERIIFTAIFDVDLHEDMPTALWGHVVGEDQGFHHVEVEVRRDFPWVEAAGKRILSIVENEVELFQFGQLQLDKVVELAQVYPFEVVFVYFGR